MPCRGYCQQGEEGPEVSGCCCVTQQAPAVLVHRIEDAELRALQRGALAFSVMTVNLLLGAGCRGCCLLLQLSDLLCRLQGAGEYEHVTAPQQLQQKQLLLPGNASVLWLLVYFLWLHTAVTDNVECQLNEHCWRWCELQITLGCLQGNT